MVVGDALSTQSRCDSISPIRAAFAAQARRYQTDDYAAEQYAGTDDEPVLTTAAPERRVFHRETIDVLLAVVEALPQRLVLVANLHDIRRRRADVCELCADLAVRGLNLLQRAALTQLIPTLNKLQIGLIPFSPLASGFLTGKYKWNEPPPPGSAYARAPAMLGARVLTEKNFKIIGALETFSAASGHTLLELAFSWLAAEQTVASVIAGASTPEQVRANARAAEWTLSAEELEESDRLAPP